ncbi:MAG: gamma-glutamyltransferase, partial [Bdellovibrionales bacterium]
MLSSVFLFLCLFLNVNVVFAQDFRPQPEMSTGVALKVSSTVSDRSMVVTAHPEATKAAKEILRQGGNAIDAAIAAQLVLGLVEPQSSGLGGGAFLLYYDAKSGQTYSFDGREVAPVNAPQNMFLNDDGTPMGFYEAALSGLSVGVPGTPLLLDSVHSAFGALPWGDLFDYSVSLAEEGFLVTPRLSMMVQNSSDNLKKFTQATKYFNGAVLGRTLKNPEYAQTLKMFRDFGSIVFYEGDIAKRIVQGVQAEGGYLTINDLEAYEVKTRDTLCDYYRGYKICSMNEPSSGGLTLLQMLN